MSEPILKTLIIETRASVADIPDEDWQRLAGTSNPFLRREFFQALEESGCTSPDTGWTPSYLVFRHGNQLIGLAPAYLKTHSRGEYVFDWGWAEAYQRYGLPYYPKLLVAIPFTPSVGPRLLLAPELRQHLTPQLLHNALDALTDRLGAHSWHVLFPDSEDQVLLNNGQGFHRLGCQFHWHNRNYQSFTDYLSALNSRRRKAIRKERRQVAEQDITFTRFHGQNIPAQVLAAFYVFYQATYLKRGQRPYLNQAFFEQLHRDLPEHLHLIMAMKDGQMIAGALFLQSESTLYGRYWGCLEEYKHLHFETCYYQGIELALSLGLSHFDAGAQGEHKLIRGFEPTRTHSWHGIRHPGFREAISEAVHEESKQVQAYIAEAETLLPFKEQSAH